MTKSARQVGDPGWARLIRWIVGHPALLPCLLLAIQTIPALWAKDVWFSDESRHAAVLVQLIEHGHWLVLHLGDSYYPDKPPLYFWVLAAIAWVFNSTGPAVFMAGAAISALVFLLTTIRAASLFGLSRSIALLSGILLVGNYYFIQRAHFPRMDLLFASFILLSHISFYRAVTGPRQKLSWTATAFFLAALATLTKGPIGLALPLAGVIAYLAFDRRIGSLFNRTMGLGALAFVAPMLLYLLGVYLISGDAFIRAILIEQTLQRALDSPRLAGPIYFYLLELPVIFLPWSLLLIVLPWRQIFSRGKSLHRNQHASGKSIGQRYIFISAVTSLVIISVFDYKITFLLITLLPQAALLCAIYINRLAKRRRTALFVLITISYGCAAMTIPFAAGFTLWPDHVRGEYAVGLAMVLMIVGMLVTVRRRALIFCTVVALGSTIVSLPFYLITIRGLDTVMSPREFGTYLGRVAKVGQAPAYYHPFRSGIFDYHARTAIPYFSDLDELTTYMESEHCGVLAIRSHDWANWPTKPGDVELLSERRLDYGTYMLVAWGGNACAVPDIKPNQQL